MALLPNVVPYTTVDDVKSQFDKSGTDHDTQIELMILAASELINQVTNRPDGFVASDTATARTFSGTGNYVIRVDDCVEITLVEAKESPTDTDYVAWDAGSWIAFRGSSTRPNFNHLPYTGIMASVEGDIQTFLSGRYTQRPGFKPESTLARNVPTVRVTAKWGYAVTCPALIQTAALAQVCRWYKRATSAWADTIGQPETGMLMYRKVMDPDVTLMLERSRLIKR